MVLRMLGRISDRLQIVREGCEEEEERRLMERTDIGEVMEAAAEVPVGVRKTAGLVCVLNLSR